MDITGTEVYKAQSDQRL